VTDADVPTEMSEVDADLLVKQIIEEIDRPQQGDITEQGSDGYLDPGILPGFGEEYDDCGDEIPHFCTECGATMDLGRTCYRSVCPRCAPMWDVERAEVKTARLQSVAKYMSSTLGCPVYKHHVVISPPDDWFLACDDPLDRTFEVVKQILKLMNAEGIICYHGWTGADGDDRGEWPDRVFNDRNWEGDVRAELKPNPHFHCIVASPFIAGGEITRRVEDRTGWTIERVADDDTGRSLDDMYAVARALTYSISHTSIMVNPDGDNQAQIRTFGERWHGGKDTRQASVYDNVRRKAEYEVRKVAPTTLGIAPNTLRCEQPIPDHEQSDESIDPLESFDDAESGTEGTAESCDHDDCADDHDESDGCEMVDCKAPIKPISEAAEYVEDDDWIETAMFSDQLIRTLDDWEDQSQMDTPPPMVQAFSV